MEGGDEDRSRAPEEAMTSIVMQIQSPQIFHGSQKRSHHQYTALRPDRAL
jgi:hypothetical protein